MLLVFSHTSQHSCSQNTHNTEVSMFENLNSFGKTEGPCTYVTKLFSNGISVSFMRSSPHGDVKDPAQETFTSAFVGV